MAKSIKFKSAVGGALAGAANGLFGAGGGTLLVPILTRWAKLDDKKALATTMCVMLPLCVVSAAVYVIKNPPGLLSSAVPYLVGGMVGGLIGGRVFKKMPTAFLRKAFAFLLIYGGIRSFL